MRKLSQYHRMLEMISETVAQDGLIIKTSDTLTIVDEIAHIRNGLKHCRTGIKRQECSIDVSNMCCGAMTALETATIQNDQLREILLEDENPTHERRGRKAVGIAKTMLERVTTVLKRFQKVATSGRIHLIKYQHEILDCVLLTIRTAKLLCRLLSPSPHSWIDEWSIECKSKLLDLEFDGIDRPIHRSRTCIRTRTCSPIDTCNDTGCYCTPNPRPLRPILPRSHQSALSREAVSLGARSPTFPVSTEELYPTEAMFEIQGCSLQYDQLLPDNADFHNWYSGHQEDWVALNNASFDLFGNIHIGLMSWNEVGHMLQHSNGSEGNSI